MLKDVYSFYKNSSKRKIELNSTTLRCDQLFNAFLTEIEAAVDEGIEELRKTPSIRLKKWNATRRLGRAACLKAICDAYPYILEHLYTYSRISQNPKKSRETAASLYDQLICYETFLFIWFYRDLAEPMARSSRMLQERAVTIRDIGRIILNLQETLKSSYPECSLVPRALVGSGEADNVLHSLFGGDINCTIQSNTNLANCLAIHQLEECLHPVQAVQTVERSVQPVRITRGVDNSAKYMDILPRRLREERAQENQPALTAKSLKMEVHSRAHFRY